MRESKELGTLGGQIDSPKAPKAPKASLEEDCLTCKLGGWVVGGGKAQPSAPAAKFEQLRVA